MMKESVSAAVVTNVVVFRLSYVWDEVFYRHEDQSSLSLGVI